MSLLGGGLGSSLTSAIPASSFFGPAAGMPALLGPASQLLASTPSSASSDGTAAMNSPFNVTIHDAPDSPARAISSIGPLVLGLALVMVLKK